MGSEVHIVHDAAPQYVISARVSYVAGVADLQAMAAAVADIAKQTNLLDQSAGSQCRQRGRPCRRGRVAAKVDPEFVIF